MKVKLASSTGFLTGAYVGLATSQENLDNNVYLQQKGTNSSGSADFGQLNPGNYYYECATEIAGTIYAGEGQVQITADKDLELTLEIR